MIKKLYPYRFELFFTSQIAVLFGSLVFPVVWFEEVLSPMLFLLNIAAGILLISNKKKLMWAFILLFAIAAFVFGGSILKKTQTDSYQFIRMGVYFVFYIVVTLEIIKQVWRAKSVNKNVIIGLMSGYVSLGLLAFFMFISIEMANPGSFEGLLMASENLTERIDSLLYYSYITLLTIGYGEIIPLTPVAQKAAILTGLAGQFYLVIITAVVVEKYIVHRKK
ncbi:ion channel [Maribacter sp. HTCC2170]|uniref:ion channel n=1 Tax=Maribacter sp. (strain HTCC2170 / KCCM 42371) TaxID=313603 RepID=UPI00006AFCF4|nr:ion channel [Maribacter sp. HTCC2170]EAR01155.1 ion transport family protein [Maribacter sp. HTCC2170]